MQTIVKNQILQLHPFDEFRQIYFQYQKEILPV